MIVNKCLTRGNKTKVLELVKSRNNKLKVKQNFGFGVANKEGEHFSLS